VDGIWCDISPWPDASLFGRARELEESVSSRPRTPPWADGLPAEAVVARVDVPELPSGQSMTFDARWRAVTMARLYGRCGWTFKRIGEHFGVGPERARQLVRLAGYKGWARLAPIPAFEVREDLAGTEPHRTAGELEPREVP
jgi:hypothetical protein